MANIVNSELTGTQLKTIALVTMIIDHIGAFLLVHDSVAYWTARLIGRLAFPLYCFLLVEGFVHTRDVKKYLGRLILFAMISELPFDMAHNRFHIYTPWSWEYVLRDLFYSQNVFFTLALGLMALMGYVRLNNVKKPAEAIFWCMAVSGLAWMLRTDYDYAGIALICIFYRFRQEPQMRAVWGAGTLLLAISPLEWPALVDFWLISRYHGSQGEERWKWLFYAAYPIHLILLWLIAKLL